MSSPAERPERQRRPQTFLAFDYGLKRTGVASGSRLLGHGVPLTTIAAEGEVRLACIAALIAEWQPDALVVGVPCHPDGAPHENTRRAKRFAGQLRTFFRLRVVEVDERYSTTVALAAGARDADAAAAALLLDQHLRRLEQEERQAQDARTEEPPSSHDNKEESR